MKIIIILPDFSAGGAERVLIRLANEWSSQKKDVSIFVIRKSGPLQNLVADQVVVKALSGFLRLPFWVNVFFSFFVLTKYLYHYRGGVVTSLTGTSIFVSFCHFLSQSRSRLIIREACSLSNIKGGLKYWLARFFYKHADCVVAVSLDVKKEISALMPSLKVELIRNPVDIAYIRECASQKSSVMIPTDRKIILAVGRLSHQKGFDVLVESMRWVRSEIPEALLLIVGEGPERYMLLKKISEHSLGSHVVLTGFVENPYPIMKCADLVVCSSRWEGFPNVILEAMALRKRIVATECAGVKGEFVLDNEGVAMVQVEDAKGMAKAIARHINGVDQDYSEFLQRYSPLQASQKYLNVVL